MNTTATTLHGDGFFTIDAFLTAPACQKLIAYGEQQGFAEAPITTAHGFEMIPEVRNNERVMFDDVELAKMLWARIEKDVPAQLGQFWAMGLNERFRFYRYAPGQYFRWHRDGCFARSRDERSLLTLLVYLNEDFVGGETEFDTGNVFAVRPKTGRALVFEHGLRHQGAPVREGRKYVLRTDVMYQRG